LQTNHAQISLASRSKGSARLAPSSLLNRDFMGPIEHHAFHTLAERGRSGYLGRNLE